MRGRSLFALPMVLVAFGALIAGCSDGSGDPVELRTLGDVVPVERDGAAQLAYELVVENASDGPIDVVRVDVLSDGVDFASFEGDDLEDLKWSGRSYILGTGDASGPIPPEGEGVFLFWFEVPPDAVPEMLTKMVMVESLEGGDPMSYRLEVPVSDELPIVLGPPLRGGNWLAVELDAVSHHRTDIERVNGELRLGQRFAIDWYRVDPSTGRPFSGDRSQNSSYLAYGAEVLAVGDGTVVAVVDGVPESPPSGGGGPVDAIEITLDTAGGNYVLLELAGDRFATYAHLVPGSITVEVGAKVQKGDVLGLVGNSGNSGDPHLHFGISRIFDTDRASGLDADGLPFVFETYEIERGPGLTPGVRTMEMPITPAIMSFPEG